MFFKYCWIKLIVLEIFQSSNRIVCTDFLDQDRLVCYEYLVSGTKYNVSDEQMSASSQYDTLHAAKWGRLNMVYVKGEHIGGWAADNKTTRHYIEVRFNELSIIQAIATQGRNITGDSVTTECYVTKYHVYYRLDDTRKWAAVLGGPGQEPMVFQGNNDSNSIRINKLPRAVQARLVRILVNDSQGYPSMRFDVLGCPVSQDCTFEDGFCNWINLKNRWTRIVNDSQRYIVITGKNKNKSNTANLFGPEVDTGYNLSCLSFSYKMSGDENNFLSVLLLLNKTTTLGKLHGEDYDGWINAFYEIENNGEKYRIQFLADVTMGFIGLDNISLIFEPCPKREKDNKTSEVLVVVAVGVGVLGLSVLIVIGIYVGRRRPFKSCAATTSIKTDLKMALRNEMSIDTVQEYAYVIPGKNESVSPDPIYDDNQGVQRGHAVVSTQKRKLRKICKNNKYTTI